jgi:hypothetical protein
MTIHQIHFVPFRLHKRDRIIQTGVSSGKTKKRNQSLKKKTKKKNIQVASGQKSWTIKNGMISIGFGGIRTDPTSTSRKFYRQVKDL